MPIAWDNAGTNEMTANVINLVFGGFNQEFINSGPGAMWDAGITTTGTIPNTANLAALPNLSSDSMTTDCSLDVPNVSGSGLGINFTQMTVAAGTAWQLEFWVKTNMPSIPANQVFMDYINTASTMRVSFVLTSARLLRVVFQATSVAATAFDTTFTLPDDTWTHLSISRTTGNLVSVYTDGVFLTSFTPASGTLTNNQIFFGCNSTFSNVIGAKFCGIKLRINASRTAPFTPPTAIPYGYSGSGSVSITPSFVGDPEEPSYVAVALDISSQMARGWAITDSGTPSFSIPHGCFNPYHVLCYPQRGGAWKPSRIREVGDPIIPSNAVANSPCFRCTVAGTSGTTEPVWPSSGTVVDGTVTWGYVGRFHPGGTYSVKDE